MKHHTATRLLFCSLSLLSPVMPLAAGTWPQWRGPRGAGQAEGKGYPLTWSDTENVAWKTAIPGRGWSSPVITGHQIWMTSAHEIPCTPEQEEIR